MHKEDSLHALIQSMTKSEKRHFKLHANRAANGKQPRYLLLFDHFATMDTFDPEAVKTHMGWHTMRAQYPMAKKYLENKALAALYSYQNKSAVEEKLNLQIQQIEVLVHKRLYIQAQKKIERARDLARHSESFNQLISLLKFERKVLIHSSESVFSVATLDRINSDLQDAIKGLSIKESTNQLYYQFFAIHYHSKHEAAACRVSMMDEVIQELQEMAADIKPYFRSRLLARNIRNQYVYHQGQYQASFEEVNQMRSMFEDRPEMKLHLPYTFVSTLHIYCNRSIRNGDIPAFLKGHCRLREFSTRNLKAEIQRLNSYLLSGLILSINSGLALENMQFYDEARSEIQTQPHRFALKFLLQAKVLLLMFDFLNEDYNSALKWLQELVCEKMHRRIRALRRFIPIVEAVLHFELGNYSFLEYRLRSLDRHAASPEAFPIELIIVRGRGW